MPKMSERDRLHELEARQLRMQEEVETARVQLRERYAHIVRSLPVERMSEKAFRLLVEKAITTGDGEMQQSQSQVSSGKTRKAASAEVRTPSGSGVRSVAPTTSPPTNQAPVVPAPS